MKNEVTDLRKVAIDIDSFFGTHTAHVDLYLNLGHEKFVRVVKKGDKYDISRIRNYKDKEVKNVYIAANEYADHVVNTLNIAKVIAKTTANPIRSKVFAVSHVAESVFQEFLLFGLTDDSFNHANDVCDCINSIEVSSEEINELIEELNRVNNELIRHSIGTSFLCSLLACSLNWKNAKTKKLLTLGGLLHDIGFINLPEELSCKQTSEMTDAELTLYKTHPEEGIKLLEKLSQCPRELNYIVKEHHELPNGKGFPNGLGSSSIYPISRSISLSDELSHLLLDTHSPLKPRLLTKAIEYLKLKNEDFYPSLYWDALSRWVSN